MPMEMPIRNAESADKSAEMPIGTFENAI